MRLKDRVALVTGAASGIGRATAILFGQEGAKVMCADIDGQGASAVAREGGEAESVQADVSRDADARRMVEGTVERFGRLDILVNCAGLELALPVTLVQESDWDRLLSVNLKGVFLSCKYAIPQMLNAGGAIVNTASDAGLSGVPMLSTYGASKGGVVLLTKALATEWARQGVRVNCVCPGVIVTPMLERSIARITALMGNLSRDQVLQRLAESHPLGRVGQAEEVARAILFLASEEASFITGVALPVDGGWAAGPPLQPQRLGM
ncbi:MAG: SDR family NAD(P)-dependent oxidoreductase [Dehalococcoidia bacterium]